jgi:hypothetical protein
MMKVYAMAAALAALPIYSAARASMVDHLCETLYLNASPERFLEQFLEAYRALLSGPASLWLDEGDLSQMIDQVEPFKLPLRGGEGQYQVRQALVLMQTHLRARDDLSPLMKEGALNAAIGFLKERLSILRAGRRTRAAKGRAASRSLLDLRIDVPDSPDFNSWEYYYFEQGFPVVPYYLFSPDGKFVLLRTGKSGLRLWDPHDGRDLGWVTHGGEEVSAAAFSPDGLRLAVGYKGNGRIEIRKGKGFLEIESYWQSPQVTVTGLVFTPAPSHLLIATEEGIDRRQISQVYEVGTGKGIYSFGQNKLRFKWSNGHQGVVTYGLHSNSKAPEIWSPNSQELKALLLERPFDRFGRDVAILGVTEGAEHFLLNDGSLWSMDWGAQQLRESYRVIPYPSGRAMTFAFAQNPARVAVQDPREGGFIHLLNIDTGEARKLPIQTAGKLELMALSPDGRYLMQGTFHGNIRIWDLNSLEVIEVVAAFKRRVDSIAFSSDGAVLAAQSGPSIKLWSLRGSLR